MPIRHLLIWGLGLLMNKLNITLFGKFSASVGSRPLPPFRTSKVQALLIYLVLENFHHAATIADSSLPAIVRPLQRTAVSHRREALMTLLWPNLDLKSAQDNLRQTLYQLSKAIPDQQQQDKSCARFITSSRLAVAVNPTYQIQLDVADFSAHSEAGQLEKAVDLYGGDFLQDFFLPDNFEFEAWAQTQRSMYRHQVLEALDRLTRDFLHNECYEQALQFARRQLAIDDLLERAHRQAMLALARLGQRETALIQYESCRQQLTEELGVDPSQETETLLLQILKDEIRPGDRGDHHVPSPLPMLQWEQEEVSPIFVGRKQELAVLQNNMARTMEGFGQLLFITGGAGRGKTALVSAFSRLASTNEPDLLVLNGNCRGLTGSGEAYLPWRQILAQLSGDSEGPAILSHEQILRLQAAMPVNMPIVCEKGLDLIGTLLSSSDLRSRAATVGSPKAEWFRLLCHRLDNPQQYNAQNDWLFSQVTAVLKEVSKKRPLLVVIDDLHWIDASSANLMLHLCFELAQVPIFLIGTYRPEEVLAGSQHPLTPILSELKRRFGDIWLDLSAADEHEGREFIDAYLDHEPNTLPSAFRDKLFEYTGGHALFTIELLRAMQERGELFQDGSGTWHIGEDVQWQNVPTRVEGVIEQRFGRLDSDLQKVLTVAAVQGDSFTAEIIADIQGLDATQLIRRLSGEVERQQRLIEAEGLHWSSGRRLAQYRFRHQLFQQFLYQQVDEVERAYLHEAVGQKLETLHSDGLSEPAVLAWHFDQAGNELKALPYLLQAGDAARLLYAGEGAAGHYEKALAILKGLGDYERAAKVLMKLGLTHMNAFNFESARTAYDESFTLTRQSAAGLNQKDLPPAPHALRLVMQTPVPTLDIIQIGVENLGLFPGLVQITADLDIIPDVAHSWDILDDGCTYVFHLRDDVFWSDGRTVTAHDFTFAWLRVLNPHNSSPFTPMFYDIFGAVEYCHSTTPDKTKLGFKALDDLSLMVQLIHPTAYFLYILAQQGAYAVPRHVVECYGEEWAEPEHIVTCGPFALQSSGEKDMFLHRNPAYHGSFTGNVDLVHLRYNDIEPENVQLYEEGEIDITSIGSHALPLSQFNKMLQVYADEYKTMPALSTESLIFNTTIPPFDDVRVRRAFAMTVNHQNLARVADGGHHFPATGGFVPMGIPGHVPDARLPYNLDEARRLLVEAGYPDGRNLPVLRAPLLPICVPVTSEAFYQPWVELLGVKIDWPVIPWSQYFAYLRSEEPHIINLAWKADYPDPDNFLRVGLHELSSWRHEQYEALIKETQHLLDHNQRLHLFRRAQAILVEEAPLLPIFYINYHMLVKPWIKNFQSKTISRPFLQHVIIEPH